MMKVAVLFSGGKDSTFALWCAQMQGWQVVALVTVFPESDESWMFHYPALKWTTLQAEAAGIPQVKIQTKGVKERELRDLAEGLRQVSKDEAIDGIVSGAVASEYQRTRLDNVCQELDIKSFAPLWHKNEEQLVREQVSAGFEFILTACNALGLDQRWLGRRIGSRDIDELTKLKERYGLSIAFEGGEAETFVLKAPVFRDELSIVKSTPHWQGDSGHLILEEVKLEP
jgi:diphthine-ammonia ligase